MASKLQIEKDRRIAYLDFKNVRIKKFQNLNFAKVLVHDLGLKCEISSPLLFLAKLVKKSVWRHS